MENIKPRRVLQIIGIVCGGGVESVIMNYYRHINRRNVQFDFVVDGKEKSLLDDEIKSLGGKVHHVTPYKENIFNYMYDMYKIMRNNEYEIVHDNMNTIAFFSLLPAWLANKKIRILHNHTTNVRASKENIKYLLKILLRPFAKFFANRFFACSSYAGEWMYGEKMVKNGYVKIINNAIELEKFSFSYEARRALRKELGISDNTVVIGHVGRFVPQKNHKFLISVFEKYLKVNDDALLILIGEGPLQQETLKKVEESGFIDKVRFLGLCKNVHMWYNAMDVFFLPSLYEGLPLVAIEAQANGVPVCMSTLVTKEAFINENCYGLDLSSINQWCDLINNIQGKRVYDSQQKLEEIGFSITKESADLEKFYLEC